MLRLAIIDDDPSFTRGLVAGAEAAGVGTIDLTAERARPLALKAAKLDAVLIDPDAIGAGFWAYLAEVCGELPDLSVLVCARPTDLASRVRGLRLGADDWITKPASASEVFARVEASRRPGRSTLAATHDPLFAGELEIRPAEVDARASGRPLGLTPREFELLHFLVREGGRVLGRETIYQRVWGHAMVAGERSVYTYVRRLRIKLEAGSPRWVYIHTHPGIGYRFEPTAPSPARGGARSIIPLGLAVGSPGRPRQEAAV